MDNKGQSAHSAASDSHRRGAMDVPAAREPDPLDLERGYEATDLGLRMVAFWVLSMIVGVAVTIGIVKWFNDTLVAYVQDEQKEAYDDTRPHHLPPDPRLQPSVGHPGLDRQDMDKLREEQIGTVNRETGRLEGGLGNVGFEWDAQAGQPRVTPVLQGRVSQWFGSPASSTQPSTAPAGAAPNPAAAPEATSTGAPAPAASVITQPTTAPAATQPAEPAAPTTPPNGSATPTPAPPASGDPAAKPADAPSKPADAPSKPADAPSKSAEGVPSAGGENKEK